MDELLDDDGAPRPVARGLMELLDQLGVDELRERQRMSDVEILTMGISFTIYSDGENIDRAWPFDVIPRLISGEEWERVSQGLMQRLRALNMFIDDMYNDQRIIAAGIFPGELLEDATNFRQECRGVHPKFGVWAHISGSDLVRAGDGQFYVLEDNLRVPSGVSYVLENRVVAKRAFPELFERHLIRPVDGYTDELNKLLMSLAPAGRRDPNLVVLTPGIFNSAYFEHSFLAQQMGAELVEGADLVVGDDECVYMKTVQGLERVDVIYRRIDDLFLDPEAFNPDSMLGVPGLMRAWKAGNVGIANAPGAGVADDKCVYAWVPDMVRYYLGEEPLIPTCRRSDACTTTSAPTCSIISTSWCSNRRTRAADTGSSSAIAPLRRCSRRWPSRSAATRATGWRSRFSTCRRPPRSSPKASPRGTSTCVRSSSPASTAT